MDSQLPRRRSMVSCSMERARLDRLSLRRMVLMPTWSKAGKSAALEAGKSAALEAAVPEAVAGRPVGPSLPWEHRASQSYQPRPEEARGPATGTAKGGGGGGL